MSTPPARPAPTRRRDPAPQHEYDHLDGTLYVDRLDEKERARVQPELDKLATALDSALEPAL